MASAFSHVVVASAIGSVVPRKVMTWPLLGLGAMCSVVPDLDWIGYHYTDVAYASFWGHRGFTHSLFFALLLSALLAAAFYGRRDAAISLGAFLYLFVCTASHGVLDAMTNAGEGVAFFSPFDTTRYWLPFRPVVCSPMSIERFFSERGAEVMASELKWLWTPSIALVVISFAVRSAARAFRRVRSSNGVPRR
jgi:inner membrane protein